MRLRVFLLNLVCFFVKVEKLILKCIGNVKILNEFLKRRGKCIRFDFKIILKLLLIKRYTDK